MSTSSDSTSSFFPAEHSARIIGHMNDDHADAVLNYVRHFGGVQAAESAHLDAMDQNGMDISYAANGAKKNIRISYPAPLTSPGDAHKVLVEMAMTAAAKAPASSEQKDTQREVDIIDHLLGNVKTLVLGTVSAAGEPDASVAPAAIDRNNAFYVYVSALSTHTENIATTERASVFIIEDEATARNLLARKRLTFSCTSQLIERGSETFQFAMGQMHERYGPVMKQLEQMTDFKMYQLTPLKGRLVSGFGQAYDLEPNNWTSLLHVSDVGHDKAPRQPRK